ncbi:UNVERIFIED_CONTAM: hypothetical protein K2H54_014970 [Gekko kuhli]
MPSNVYAVPGAMPCFAPARGYYEAVHDGRGPASPEYPFLGGWYYYMGQEPLSYKRRGGVVDHRDIILAHQAHKIHNTPQAQRKEWE